jgi:acyl-CoA thioesterase FadM
VPLVLGVRYPLAGLRSLRKPPVGLLEESRLDLRVRLRDCDVLMHVNNGRYLSLMDLGRIDHSGRSGLVALFRERGWSAVAGGVTIRFRRELRWRSRYVLRTRIVGWHDGWCFWEQVFERADGSLAARAYAKVAPLDAQGRRVDTALVVEALGLDPTSPPLPPGIADWQASDFG